MSLTGMMRDKCSSARQFFMEFEKKDGTKKCLALLQSAAPMQPLSFTPSSKSVHAFIGTATDYLIRYAANRNTLQFETTVAAEALLKAPLRGASARVTQQLNVLFTIGKLNLDGRDAFDNKAVYSATALAIMDNFYRSGCMPELFQTPIRKDKKEIIKKHHGKNLNEKTTSYLFGEYFAKLGGDEYAQEISNLIRCLVPAFDGAYFSEREKEALWDRFYTGAPQRQRRSVERYNIVKRA